MGRNNLRVQQKQMIGNSRRGSGKLGVAAPQEKFAMCSGRHMGPKKRGRGTKALPFLFAAPLLGVALKSKDAKAFASVGYPTVELKEKPIPGILDGISSITKPVKLAVATTEQGPDIVKTEKVVPVETKTEKIVEVKPKEAAPKQAEETSSFWLIAGPILGALVIGAALMKWRSIRQGDKFYKNAKDAKVLPKNPEEMQAWVKKEGQ